MHKSIFSYNITRAYPFKWFTPVTITGVVAFTALFTILNYFSNGYQLVSVISSNPNNTIQETSWYSSWSSLLVDKLQPTCQPVTIPVGVPFSTNQSGLVYTLNSVTDSLNSTLPLPSLIYLNNQVKDCKIDSIQLVFESTERPTSEIMSSWWGIVARALVTCNVGAKTLNATANYNALPEYPTPGVSSFLSRDPKGKASLYWAESLLSAYWASLANAMKEITNEDGYGLADYAPRKGFVSLKRSPDATDISAPDFFTVVVAQFLDHDDTWTSGSGSIQDLRNSGILPSMWSSVNGLAKSMYSAVIVDLGQGKGDVASNIVTDPDTLASYSKILTTYDYGGHAQEKVGPATAPYSASDNTFGPLGITPSVISGEYLCQVPRRKSAGNIVVSVLVADFVFLNVVWMLYTLAVGFFGLRRQTDAQHCEGCLCDDGSYKKLSV